MKIACRKIELQVEVTILFKDTSWLFWDSNLEIIWVATQVTRCIWEADSFWRCHEKGKFFSHVVPPVKLETLGALDPFWMCANASGEKNESVDSIEILHLLSPCHCEQQHPLHSLLSVSSVWPHQHPLLQHSSSCATFSPYESYRASSHYHRSTARTCDLVKWNSGATSFGSVSSHIWDPGARLRFFSSFKILPHDQPGRPYLIPSILSMKICSCVATGIRRSCDFCGIRLFGDFGES